MTPARLEVLSANKTLAFFRSFNCSFWGSGRPQNLQHMHSQWALRQSQRGLRQRTRLLRIPLRQGTQRKHQPLPRLRFGAAHELKVAATPRTGWLWRQTSAAGRTAVNGHASAWVMKRTTHGKR